MLIHYETIILEFEKWLQDSNRKPFTKHFKEILQDAFYAGFRCAEDKLDQPGSAT
jgi:hypothetical protein